MDSSNSITVVGNGLGFYQIFTLFRRGRRLTAQGQRYLDRIAGQVGDKFRTCHDYTCSQKLPCQGS